VTLIRDRRVGEPVAEADPSRVEPRPDHLRDVLGPVRAVEEQLCERRERDPLRAEEEPPDRIAGRSAARRARLDDRMAGGAEVRRDVAEVRRLPGAFDALEGNEP